MKHQIVISTAERLKMNTGESIFAKWFTNKDFHKQQTAYFDFQKCLENWEPRSDIR